MHNKKIKLFVDPLNKRVMSGEWAGMTPSEVFLDAFNEEENDEHGGFPEGVIKLMATFTLLITTFGLTPEESLVIIMTIFNAAIGE